MNWGQQSKANLADKDIGSIPDGPLGHSAGLETRPQQLADVQVSLGDVPGPAPATAGVFYRYPLQAALLDDEFGYSRYGACVPGPQVVHHSISIVLVHYMKHRANTVMGRHVRLLLFTVTEHLEPRWIQL